MKILAPIGWLYGWIMQLRNALYDRGILKSYDLSARTISIGNITTGGTGKTPLVAYVAELLADNGEKVCILTRGYGRRNENERVSISDGKTVLADVETGGDEPVELAHKLLGRAIVVAAADRVAAARWAKKRFDITVFVLDDGFQHRRARRDLDIVCIDATDPFGNGEILPAGKLRESVKSLNRADVVVITRSEQVENIKELEDHLRGENAEMQIFRATTSISDVVTLTEFHAGMQSSRRPSLKEVFAFSGIGNPGSFFRTLEIAGIPPIEVCELKDHYRYTQKDVESIEASADLYSSEGLITTAKDAVKLANLNFKLPCYVALSRTSVDDEEGFRKLITSS